MPHVVGIWNCYPLMAAFWCYICKEWGHRRAEMNRVNENRQSNFLIIYLFRNSHKHAILMAKCSNLYVSCTSVVFKSWSSEINGKVEKQFSSYQVASFMHLSNIKCFSWLLDSFCTYRQTGQEPNRIKVWLSIIYSSAACDRPISSIDTYKCTPRVGL